jgi:hypothetical protein
MSLSENQKHGCGGVIACVCLVMLATVGTSSERMPTLPLESVDQVQFSDNNRRIDRSDGSGPLWPDTVADAAILSESPYFREAIERWRKQCSMSLHRLLLIVALSLFLIFHAALLYYYPKRRANLMFCITLTLSLITLVVLDVQERSQWNGFGKPLYWTFLGMLLLCMLSGLALTHALWRGDLPKCKLLAWAAVFAGLYLVGWLRDDRLWALAVLPLSTLDIWRRFFRDVWRRLPGAWVFGFGLTCFTVAQAVNLANNLMTLALPDNGLIAYLWVYGFVTFLACVSTVIGREFAGAVRKLEELTATLDRRVQQVTRELETKLLAQARLETLRYQLNPHFLFNALNSVEALSREEPAQIPEVIRRLCECLRYALRPKKNGFATLQQELDVVASYLGVEEVRFEEQLLVDVDVSAAACGQTVPEFLLQPLVENAIKYGMQTSQIPLRVVIRGDCTEETLRVEVRNTGHWAKDGESVCSEGVGLENLKDRLELLYGDRYGLTIHQAEGWVSVAVKIPLQRTAPNATATTDD